MTIKHLEELDTKKFIESLSHLKDFVVSEKVDGSELIFGFDSSGNFYTSREEKGGKRFYQESDWPKQFWTTGFRSAHLFLENNKEILKEYLKSDEAIEIEILFGDLPNTVEYNLKGINKIVLLRPINCDIDFIKIKEKLIFKDSIMLKNIPKTNDGSSIIFTEEKHNWEFASIPIVKASKLKNNSKKLFNDLLLFLAKENNNISNLDLSLKRTTPKNKDEILSIRNTIQNFKNEIKNSLIKEILYNYKSNFGSNWIEGLVYRKIKTGFQFKLIDKNQFTKINKEKHEFINSLRNLYWKSFKNDLLKIADIEWVKKDNIISFEDLSSMGDTNVNLSLLQFRCEHNVNGLLYELKNYQGDNQRILEEFCSLKLRTEKILDDLKLGTCFEHYLETILFDGESQLKHLKSFAKLGEHICEPITKKEVDQIYFYIWQILGIEDIELAKLGSLQFAKISNDMDIGIDTSVLSAEKLISILNKNRIEHNISKGLNIIHCAFPINHSFKKYAQVDFILTDNLNWVKFWFTGSTFDSKYKGLYRNALLRAIAGATNKTEKEDDDDEIYYRSGWVLVPSSGLEYQIKERPIGKSGKRNKTFSKKEVLGSHSKDLNYVLRNIFQTCQVKVKDVDNFENLWNCVKKYKTKDEIELIKQITIKILKEIKYKIPKEFLYDI